MPPDPEDTVDSVSGDDFPDLQGRGAFLRHVL